MIGQRWEGMKSIRFILRVSSDLHHIKSIICPQLKYLQTSKMD